MPETPPPAVYVDPDDGFCPYGWPNAASRCTCGCEEEMDD